MGVLGHGRGLESFLELFCVDPTEYELISTRLDPFQLQLDNLGKLISVFFSFFGRPWAPGRPFGTQGVHVGVPLGARPDLGTSRALKYCK